MTEDERRKAFLEELEPVLKELYKKYGVVVGAMLSTRMFGAMQQNEPIVVYVPDPEWKPPEEDKKA